MRVPKKGRWAHINIKLLHYVTIYSSFPEQVLLLVGRAARPDFLKRLTWLAINHHPEIKEIDTVSAFHFGNQFLVEIHIVLPELMTVKDAHEIQVNTTVHAKCIVSSPVLSPAG